MSVTDTDYSILMTKLEALEHRIKKLEDKSYTRVADLSVKYIQTHTIGKSTADQEEVVHTKEPFIKYDDILAVL